MKPYYEEAGITIYCGDCREIIPIFPISDLLLTDPPYGIGRDGSRPSTSSHGGRKAYEFMGWDSERPAAEVFQILMVSAKEQIIWGANYFSEFLPPKMGWIVWDKGQRICGSDGELAFTSFDAALRIITLNRVELQLDGASHPTQKPLRLMLRCIAHADKQRGRICDSVLDPFMGSGTTLVAAKQLGRSAIGIEIEEKYCQIAVERLRQSVLPFESQPKAELRQLSMLKESGHPDQAGIDMAIEDWIVQDAAEELGKA